MRIQFTLNNISYEISETGIPISIPLQFNGSQPNTYGVPKATAQAFEGSGFIGDTRKGGSCNFESYTLIPHCNGTHTEGIGHLSLDRISIFSQLTHRLIPATVISITPKKAIDSNDHYTPSFNAEDSIISLSSLQSQQHKIQKEFTKALIIRTLPNLPEKKQWDYTLHAPAFFSEEAMLWVREQGVQHLLIDLPSVDRLMDEGKLSSHRIFWELEPDNSEITPQMGKGRTITEMIYVSDNIPDGRYLLNLQIAPFASDASPSNPVLFPIKKI